MQFHPFETNLQLESVPWEDTFELTFSEGANIREIPRGNPSVGLLYVYQLLDHSHGIGVCIYQLQCWDGARGDKVDAWINCGMDGHIVGHG